MRVAKNHLHEARVYRLVSQDVFIARPETRPTGSRKLWSKDSKRLVASPKLYILGDNTLVQIKGESWNRV
uniref:Uncharacterized protein n=1 Tax=Anopheles albimanus TaxID=7167 RepID=A0A182FAC8_ANOAL